MRLKSQIQVPQLGVPHILKYKFKVACLKPHDHGAGIYKPILYKYILIEVKIVDRLSVQ